MSSSAEWWARDWASMSHATTELRTTSWHARFWNGLCWFQGLYFSATGIWPLVSVRTFKLVTGEKGKTDNLETGLDADHWLLMTVSVLITSIGITLLLSAIRRTQAVELAVLAIASSVGLTSIDVIYTARGVILPVYLLDAAVEIPLILAWTIAVVEKKGRR
jgi:hypothetical protein